MTTPTGPPDFDCTAYGPEGREFGALCFTSELGQRACPSLAACHLVMTGERQRVFSRISEMAAGGDPVGVFLADEFPEPGQILNGDDDTGKDDQ